MQSGTATRQHAAKTAEVQCDRRKVVETVQQQSQIAQFHHYSHYEYKPAANSKIKRNTVRKSSKISLGDSQLRQFFHTYTSTPAKTVLFPVLYQLFARFQ